RDRRRRRAIGLVRAQLDRDRAGVERRARRGRRGDRLALGHLLHADGIVAGGGGAVGGVGRHGGGVGGGGRRLRPHRLGLQRVRLVAERGRQALDLADGRDLRLHRRRL